MTLRTSCYTALVMIALIDTSYGQDSCFRRPTPVESLQDVHTHYLVLRGPANTYYVIEGDCLTIDRSQFPRVLYFSLLNRFAEELDVSSGYVFIKSDRTFSNSPPEKISLSRGEGWFYPNQEGNAKPVDALDYEPFDSSIESWNAAHSDKGDPVELSKRLKTDWHAYALEGLTLPSTQRLSFWKIDESFDRNHGVMTNYILRFDVNKSDRVGKIPFQVYLQKEVQQIDLVITSNVQAYSGHYKFIVH